MVFDPEIHHRRSIRLKDYDYSEQGAYFVTLCVQERVCLFGEVIGSDMVLNPEGRQVAEIWRELPARFPQVALDEYIVMPNHFHGIILIDEPVGALIAAPGFKTSVKKGAASGAPTLGAIIRAFKSLSAIGVNRFLDRQGQPLWQRNYFERVLRGQAELDVARRYILENPLKWQSDRDNPLNMPLYGRPYISLLLLLFPLN